MTPAATPEALVEARALVRHSLKVGAPGLSETAREAVLRSIMLKLDGKVLAPVLADLQRVTAEVEALKGALTTIKTWIDTDLPAGTSRAGFMHRVITKALDRAALTRATHSREEPRQ